MAVGLFGDGALEEGVSYESLNFAALWSLPVVFVCENNSEGALGSAGGGFPTSVSAVDDLTKIPETFGIPVETVDGRDVEAVYDVVGRAVAHARARKGPYFVHVATARFAGTQPLWPNLPTGPTDISMAWDDSNMAGEHEAWYREHDPVLRYARELLASGDIDQDELTALDEQVRERLEPRPASSRSTARGPRRRAHSTTYSPEEGAEHGNQELRRRDAGRPRAAFMEEDPTFAVMGNEVLGIGPEAGHFEPFQKKYSDRIYFPPCSEAAFAALAAGAAMCGQRIFAHLGLAPFTYPAFSSIASEIATGAAVERRQGGRAGHVPHEPRPPARRRRAALREPARRCSGTCRGSRSRRRSRRGT